MTTPDPTTSELTGTWRLDPDRTSVVFHTKALWLVPVKGTFTATGGEVTVEADGTFNGQLVLDSASVDTRNKKRDTHLRTADFFDVENHPTLTFTVNGGRVDSHELPVNGTLEIHGQSRPLTVPTKVIPDGDGADLVADVTIDRTDWGLTWAKMGAGVKTRIAISARFARA
jgi:polyisoprenoid-binding protein YceI